MKVELFIEGRHVTAVFAAFLPELAAARQKDAEEWNAQIGTGAVTANYGVATSVVALTDDPAPAAEEEKPKRGRAAKSKAEEPAKEPELKAEPEPAIRATPEDRQPAEEPEVVTGEVLDDKVYTRDDVKAALGAYAEKFGMAQAASEGVKLMGAPRISALPEDPAAFAAAVKALNEAVARG